MAGDPLAALGRRARHRATPRIGIGLAGVGSVLAVLGALILATDELRPSGSLDGGADFERAPGILLGLLVAGAGYGLLAWAPDTPRANAGALAFTLGVPFTLTWLTLDAGSNPPYSAEAVLLLSTLAWGAAYWFGPGRGRLVLLTAALFGVWFSLLQVTEQVFDNPFFIGFPLMPTADVELPDFPEPDFPPPDFDVEFEPPDIPDPSFPDFPEPTFPDFPEPEFPDFPEPEFQGLADAELVSSAQEVTVDAPDLTTVGWLSLLLALAYLTGAFLLHRREQRGMAAAGTIAGTAALVVGLLAVAPDLESTGTGLLMLLIGGGLLYAGAQTARRFTAWGGATLVGLGVFTLVADATDDSATAGGVTLLVVGALVVLAGDLLAEVLGEEPEVPADAPVEPIQPMQPPQPIEPEPPEGEARTPQ